MGENDLLHFRKKTSKREKAYPKMGENPVKIFKSRGGVPSPKPPRSRRHWEPSMLNWTNHL